MYFFSAMREKIECSLYQCPLDGAVHQKTVNSYHYWSRVK